MNAEQAVSAAGLGSEMHQTPAANAAGSSCAARWAREEVPPLNWLVNERWRYPGPSGSSTSTNRIDEVAATRCGQVPPLIG